MQVKHLLTEIQQVAQQTFPTSIEISLDVASELRTVMADATQIHQVLMNLVVNARDAMPNGGTLHLKAQNLEIEPNHARMQLNAQSGRCIAIEISDTGMGIPPEIIDRIFEPLFTTKETAGTGLGLSIVLEIVKSHGGFMNVQSEVDRGTQVIVYLPALDEPD